tara:strand:+ start:246 stop:1043 length:798 start_codon:yes stop_codon:yes gene_type:complete
MTILGCITKYRPEDIRPYVESIHQSGFKGRKVMMVYDIPQETIDYLKSKGWELYQNELQQHIILQRFRDIYKLLEQFPKDETIIWTDVKDVIFQKDPTEWIDYNMDDEIMAFSESITMKDDPWACVNSGTSFPMEWEWLQNKVSYCAGTIVGEAEYLRDLFINIYRWSMTTSNPDQLSDQAAYNVLINLNGIVQNVQKVNQEEGFVTQLGTVLVKKDEFKDVLLEPTPIVDENYIVKNQKGEPFCLVHQYDRIPEFKDFIYQKYS